MVKKGVHTYWNHPLNDLKSHVLRVKLSNTTKKIIFSTEIYLPTGTIVVLIFKDSYISS